MKFCINYAVLLWWYFSFIRSDYSTLPCSFSKFFKGSLSAATRAAAFVRGDDVIHKLFTELAYRYKDRAGGYTRLLRTRIRVSDAAPMAYIEENELRQSKPPTPPLPPRPALDPWIKSRLSRQFAPSKEEKSSESEI
ncbi:50S ribosomal protein L17 [Hibiscus syriacus]|uniref:50S ribosomal protein L17 n=1 Tax=Hibiscus syriacus TaxID=106335 RepID=A0A6A2Z935_HIBSY|nr:50S ribosomal protein L17 [Hibiscus syriacus]